MSAGFAIIPPQGCFSFGPNDTNAGSLLIQSGFKINGGAIRPISVVSDATFGVPTALVSEITVTVYVGRGTTRTAIGTLTTNGAGLVTSNFTYILQQGDVITLSASAAPGSNRNVGVTLF